MSKESEERDVTWGDNVIYANFSAGASRGRRRARPAKTGNAVTPLSGALEQLRAKAPWADAGVATKVGRGMRSLVTPRTTFSQWTWEFICKDADDTRRLRGEKCFQENAVLGFKTGDGFVVGEVQGSQIDPFSVRIRFPRRDISAIDEILQWLVDNPSHIEGFERGELPYAQMKQLVCDVDESLHFSCTCPDSAPTCKHAVAVGAQLIQHIDDDPMSLLEIRGFQPRDVQRRMKELVERKSTEMRRPTGILQRRLNKPRPDAARPQSQQHAEGAEVENHLTAGARATDAIRAVPADFWGNDLPRVDTPRLEPIDPLTLTDQSLLHEALLPTCILSRETLRAVSDLEDCWNHMKSALRLNDREQQW